MQFTIAIVAGVLIGWALIMLRRRAKAEADWPAWLMVLTALVGSGLFVFGYLFQNISIPTTAGIFLPVAAVIASVEALMSKDRRWQIWVAFILGLPPVLFWVYFLVGEMLFPH